VRYETKRREKAEALISMHKRHGTVVRQVLEEQLRSNAPKLIDRTLEETSLLALAIGQKYLAGGQIAQVVPDDDSTGKQIGAESLVLTKLNEIIQHLHSGADFRAQHRKAKGSKTPPTKRDAILFAAIVSGLEGLKYCSFLDNHKARPKSSDTGPKSYQESYLAPGSYRKKVQDEKCRAKQRMSRYPDSVLMEAFVTYLPGEFDQLSSLLNSRNSRDASKKLRSSIGA